MAGGVSIEKRDELLKLLFWLEGERFAESATLATLTRFVGWPEEEVLATLEHLVALGQVAGPSPEGTYELTDAGRPEGARRFRDEFAGMTGQGHGACSDPTCDCHTGPDAAAACQAQHTS